MRDRVGLALYLAAVLVASVVHSPPALAGGLLAALVLAGRAAPGVLRRAVLAVLAVNLLVSVGYAAWSLAHASAPWEALLRFNLRVLLLTTLTFVLMARVNLFRALAFSPSLVYVLGLAYSQALVLRRAHEDFRMALESRSPGRPRLRDRYRAAAASASWYVEKSLQTAGQSAQALRARGFFDD